MATYAELFGLKYDPTLKNRVNTAVIVAAETVMNEEPTTDNHVNRKLWAKQVFASPHAESERMYMAVLAANNTFTVEQIQGATDALIQANVDDHIDLFADGS